MLNLQKNLSQKVVKTILNIYMKYYEINNVGFIYKEAITKQELEKLQEDYFVFSNTKISNGEYDNATFNNI